MAENIGLAEFIAFTYIGETNHQKSMSVGSGNVGPSYTVSILAGSRDWHFANPESRD